MHNSKAAIRSSEHAAVDGPIACNTMAELRDFLESANSKETMQKLEQVRAGMGTEGAGRETFLLKQHQVKKVIDHYASLAVIDVIMMSGSQCSMVFETLGLICGTGDRLNAQNVDSLNETVVLRCYQRVADVLDGMEKGRGEQAFLDLFGDSNYPAGGPPFADRRPAVEYVLSSRDHRGDGRFAQLVRYSKRLHHMELTTWRSSMRLDWPSTSPWSLSMHAGHQFRLQS